MNGATVTVGDVATVRDGFAPQTSLVRANGRRGMLMTLLKSAGASTLDIVGRVRAGSCRSLLVTLPPEYKMDLLFDQSLFVRAAVEGFAWSRGSDRRGADGAHDFAFSRKLAEHPDRRDVHSPLDPGVAHHFWLAWARR